MDRAIPWLLIGRYALLIALTALIPIPLLDRGIENLLRRRLVRAIADRHGAELSPEEIALLGNAPAGGCWGCVASVVLWPFRKVLKTMLIVLQVKAMADLASEVLHRTLMLEEALDTGWLPGDAEAVREGMDRTLACVDTRPIERQLMGTLRDHRHDLNRVVWEATRIARERVRGERGEALALAVERDELGAEADEMSEAMVASLQATGVTNELLQWFRAEMGDVPKLPLKVDGALSPEAVLPADPEDLPSALVLHPHLEDADEVTEEPEDLLLPDNLEPDEG